MNAQLAEMTTERDDAFTNMRRLKAELEKKTMELQEFNVQPHKERDVTKLPKSTPGTVLPHAQMTPADSKKELDRLKKLYTSASEKVMDLNAFKYLAFFISGHIVVVTKFQQLTPKLASFAVFT
jgi:hypothetical protein